MSQQQLILTIEQHVRCVYGETISDYRFVMENLQLQPYCQCVNALKRCGFNVTDDTEPNYDVSFGFQVSRNSDTFFLQISMVGPFALLQRLCPNGTMAIVTLATVESPTETALIEVIASFGISLLDEQVCRHELALRPASRSEGGPFMIYNALIGEVSQLPWNTAP